MRDRWHTMDERSSTCNVCIRLARTQTSSNRLCVCVFLIFCLQLFAFQFGFSHSMRYNYFIYARRERQKCHSIRVTQLFESVGRALRIWHCHTHSNRFPDVYGMPEITILWRFINKSIYCLHFNLNQLIKTSQRPQPVPFLWVVLLSRTTFVYLNANKKVIFEGKIIARGVEQLSDLFEV